MKRYALNVKSLPTTALGHRDPLWWGVIFLIAIEGTVFALLLASYFFIRNNYEQFPPVGMPPETRMAASIGLGCLLVSAVTMYVQNQAAKRGDIRGIRRWLLISNLFIAGFLFCRYLEFKGAPLRFDDDAYGSVLWAALGPHTVHGITGFCENFLFAALMFKGPVEKKHMTDAEVNGTYWYFVVVSWVVFYLVLYLDPGLFHRSY